MQGDVVTDARVRPGGQVRRQLSSASSSTRAAREIFDAITSENVGRKLVISLDNTVYSDPVIKERIPGGHVQITRPLLDAGSA